MYKPIFTSYNIYAIGFKHFFVFFLRKAMAFCDMNLGTIYKYIAMTLILYLVRQGHFLKEKKIVFFPKYGNYSEF